MDQAVNDTPLLDRESFDEAREMLQGKFGQIVEYFLEDADGYIENIRDAVAGNAAEKAVSPAHALKSSSRQMGAFRLSEIARTIEEVARGAVAGSGGFDQAAELTDRLAATFGETRDAFLPYAART